MLDDPVRLRKVMKRVWAEALPDVPFRFDATWDEMGIDSIKAFEVVLRLEKALGARLPLELFNLESTAAELVRTLARPVQSEPGAGALVFLVPGIFGDSPLLAKLRSGLAGDLVFETVRLPGLAAPMGVLGSVGRQADLAVAQILKRQPGGDIRIVGYSTGGLVACEAASRLEKAGRRVAGVCVIDTPFSGTTKRIAPGLMEGLLPILARFNRTNRVAALHALTGGSPGGRKLPHDPESLLFRLYLRLGLLERARRLLRGAADRRDASWTAACRKHLLVRFSFRAALGWSPTPCTAPMLLIAADQLQALGHVELWRNAYPQIEVVEVGGGHTKLFEPDKLARFKPALVRLLSQSAPESQGRP